MKFKHTNNLNSSPLWLKLLIIVVPILIIFSILSFFAVNSWYNNNLEPLDINSTEEIVVVVESGSSANSIGKMLEDEGVIKSSTAFAWFVDRSGYRQNLQAGTYRFSPSQSVEYITMRLVDGDIETDLFTILPGKRIDQIEQSMIDAGFKTSEVISALEGQYDHPILRDKPAKASLEGYIYPETYQITSSTTPRDIVITALDELDEGLTPSMIAKLKKRGYNIHDAVTLASIIQNETSNIDDQPTVAQVFLKRLDEGMALGADPTFFYAAAITGQQATPDLDHPYNTRIYAGLPPGPISNFNLSTIEAVANPSSTNYLFFVAGDDGNTYFSSTLAEHQRLTALHCIELCKLQ